MILTKDDLKPCIDEEKKIYFEDGNYINLLIYNEIRLKTYRYVKCLRKLEYHRNQKGFFHKLMYVYYRRRKNRFGERLGIEMEEGCFDTGLTIYHPESIVVNGFSKIGKNCKLHGDNCIGNNGKNLDSPVLGNNIRVGVGAKIIGNVRLADDITIAAGSVVVNSCEIVGAVLAGVPAKVVKIPGGGITLFKIIRSLLMFISNYKKGGLVVC